MTGTGERARVQALKSYGVLDTPNEPEYDAIVREAAAALGTPIALISLVDENRQWFKARVGLETTETPRTISFCTHAIHAGATMTVPDAREDPRFATNPLVTGDPSIRFYAGVPLVTPTGKRIGTLCAIDRHPHAELKDGERENLERLAAKTMELFERRRARIAAGGVAAAA